MRHLTAATLIVLLFACATTSETPSEFAMAPPEPAPLQLEGAQVSAILPSRSDLEVQSDQVLWRADSEHAYPILRARERDWLVLETEIGELRASWGLLAAWNDAPLRDLPSLIEHARIAGLRAEDLVLYEEELTGAYLVGRDLYVIREGVLLESPREPLTQATREIHEASRERLERSVQSLIASLPRTSITPESQLAVVDILAQLPLQDAQANLDFIPPSFARRLVRAGWLGVLQAPLTETEQLRAAVVQSEQMLPIAEFEGPGSRMALVEDAFGDRVWTLATPERVGYAQLAYLPAYYTNTAVTRLVVRLPRGSDPLHDAARWQEVINC